MHPLLFRIPVPPLGIPLGPVLVAAAVLLSLAAALAYRYRSKESAAKAGALALGAGLSGLLLFGHVLALAPLEVPAFGALLAASVALGATTTLRQSERGGMPRASSVTVCVEALVLGILGARLGYALLYPSKLDSLSQLFAFYDGGLSAHFGIAAGATAAALSARREQLPVRAWLDAASPGLALGVTLTRIGCWLEGCDFGRVLGASAPGVVARLGTFPAESRAWVEQVLARAILPTAPGALPVHPAMLYEAAGGSALFGLVLLVRRRQTAAGASALTVLLGYAALRALVDLAREPSREVWLGRIALLLGLGLTVMAFRRARVAV